MTQIRIFLSWNQSGQGEEFAEQNFFDHRYDGDGCLFVKGWPHCWLSGDGERPNLQLKYIKIMFCSFHFGFLVTFGDEVSKIRKYYVIFVYILQGKMGKIEIKWKENHATKLTKIPKIKRQKYGMNKTSSKESGSCLNWKLL